MRTQIDRQTGSGGINGDTAKKLREDLAKIQDKLGDGKPDEAANHARELQKRLDELNRNGSITPAAYDALNSSVARLVASLPASTSEKDNGKHGEKDKGDD